jgi:hypothetical protein
VWLSNDTFACHYATARRGRLVWAKRLCRIEDEQASADTLGDRERNRDLHWTVEGRLTSANRRR